MLEEDLEVTTPLLAGIDQTIKRWQHPMRGVAQRPIKVVCVLAGLKCTGTTGNPCTLTFDTWIRGCFKRQVPAHR